MAIGAVGGTLEWFESYLVTKHAFFGAPLMIPLVWLRFGKWNYIFLESPEWDLEESVLIHVANF